MAANTPHFSKALIEKSYDKMASHYLDWTSKYPSPREEYTQKLLALISNSDNLRVLELGCGAGVPGTKLLLEHGCQVVANDISSEQLKLAKQNLEIFNDKLELSQSDMMQLDFTEASLDAVVAFYSVIHLPRDEQKIILGRMQQWLKVGGHVLINLGTKDMAEGVTDNWLGEGMYWSGFDTKSNEAMITDAGFEILESKVIDQREEEDKVIPFLWILAKKN